MLWCGAVQWKARSCATSTAEDVSFLCPEHFVIVRNTSEGVCVSAGVGRCQRVSPGRWHAEGVRDCVPRLAVAALGRVDAIAFATVRFSKISQFQMDGKGKSRTWLPCTMAFQGVAVEHFLTTAGRITR